MAVGLSPQVSLIKVLFNYVCFAQAAATHELAGVLVSMAEVEELRLRRYSVLKSPPIAGVGALKRIFGMIAAVDVCPRLGRMRCLALSHHSIRFVMQMVSADGCASADACALDPVSMVHLQVFLMLFGQR